MQNFDPSTMTKEERLSMVDEIQKTDQDLQKMKIIVNDYEKMQSEFKHLKAEYNVLVLEYNQKNNQVKFLVSDIESCQSTLSGLKSQIKKEKEQEYHALETKIKEVEQACLDLNQLKMDKDKETSALKSIREGFEQRERQFLGENQRLIRTVQDMEKRMFDEIEDCKKLKAELTLKTEELERQKIDLKPKFDEIEKLKSENEMRFNQVNLLKKEVEDRESRIGHEKVKNQLDIEAEREKVKIAEERIKSREFELNNVNKNLEDRELFLKKKETEIKKLLLRNNLKKEIDEFENKNKE